MKTLSIILLLMVQIGFAQNAAVPGALESYQTINSIGFEWALSGDDNHNAQCTVHYRQQGETTWQPAMPLYRIDIAGVANMLSGSVLFLDPGTSYEIQLTLTDVDGGNAQESMTLTTQSLPRLPTGGNTYHVTPGNGGGSGTLTDPFLGIDAAQAVAQPGDIFLLASGTYGSSRIRLTTSGSHSNYIVWKAAPGATPVWPGARMIGDYIWLEGVSIENVDYGLLTEYGYEPTGIVVRHNTFNDCHYSIQLNHGGKNWFITDNVIVGRISDYSSGAMGGEGIELEHTSGHVVAFNSISNTADGISYPGRNCDIMNNDIFHVSDDGIELDFALANVRAWENRITNAYNNGISFQNLSGHTYGAPWYVIRNQVIVANEDAIKLRDNVDRALLAHNTFVSWSGVVSASTGKLVAFQSNNNLWISVSDRYAWEDTDASTTPDWRTHLDYDGFDWNNNSFAFKWQNTRYTTLQAFQTATGLEPHGIHVQKNLIFKVFDVPQPPSLAPLQTMTLKAGCNAVDAGVVLPNINDGYTASAPDLGAYERDTALPHFGPRTLPQIRARLYLQGPAYQDGSSWKMRSGLAQNQSVTQTPYYALGWDPQQTTATPLSVVTDWVFVQLCTAPGSSPTWESSAFVSAEGELLDVDGTEGIAADVEPGHYYITIRHRNHLPVTTSTATEISVDSDTWDFTRAESQAWNHSGVVELDPGIWALAAGDVNHDGRITTRDYVDVYNQQDQTGYCTADFDLDADVDTDDYALWLTAAQQDTR